MRTLLINLTRFGDILQTQPLIHDLVADGHEVSMICLENFAATRTLLHGLHDCIVLPGSGLLASLNTDWKKALPILHNWKTTLHIAKTPTRIINLTPSVSARLLGRFLADKEPLFGFGLDCHGFGHNDRLWTSFFEVASLHRGNSPFNIVDLFRRVCGYGQTSPQNALKKPEKQLCETMQQRLQTMHNGVTPQGYVAFQLGASAVKRQWPVKHFVTLGNAIYAHCGLMPLLLGTKQEQHLAEQYAALGGIHVNLIGQTSLQELAATLTLTRLLISNDTGTMHLAAGLSVPILALFLATAQAWDTGPYLENCCCIEPNNDCHPCAFGTPCSRFVEDGSCGQLVPAEDIKNLALHYLHTGTWLNKTNNTLRIWKTQYQTTPTGTWMQLQSLSEHEDTPRTSWLRLQQHFFCQFLDNYESKNSNSSLKNTAPQGMNDPHAGLSNEMRNTLQTILQQADTGLSAILLYGNKLLQGQHTAAPRLLAAVSALTDTFEQSTHTTTISRLWQVASQERGNNLNAVLELASALQKNLQIVRKTL